MSKKQLTTAAEVANVLVHGVKNGLSPDLCDEVLTYLRIERDHARKDLAAEVDGEAAEPPIATPDSAARRRYSRACRAIWLLTDATADEEDALEATLTSQQLPPIV